MYLLNSVHTFICGTKRRLLILTFINGFCTMEYVVFSCTQGKKGGGTDILDLICVLNISLLCWFCVSTSSTCQMVQGVLVGMYLSNGSGCPWGDEVEDNFHYFYVCPLFICQRLLLFTQLRDLAYIRRHIHTYAYIIHMYT
jgi:hypothetical protein